MVCSVCSGQAAARAQPSSGWIVEQRFFRFSGTAYTKFTSLIDDDDNDPLEMADTD